MGAQTKKQTPHTPTLQMVPPPLADPSLEDDESPIRVLEIDEPGQAFGWLESLADLLSTADTGDLCHETVNHVAWIMEEIARGGQTCLRREQEAGREGH
ncbi:MAG: hypothetical protein KGL32_01225 [candidate division NC10 bacterium]|nr:hypothetical protein [candidate division NC10 bacterium]